MHSTLVFLALFSIVSADNTCSPSDVQGAAQCYDTSLKLYGLQVSNGTNLPAYQTYIHARRAYLQAGYKSAVAPMCNNQNALQKCLSQIKCFNRDTYTAMGLTVGDGYKYWADLAEYNFACGDGYNVLQKEFYCFKAVEQHSASDITNCENQLNNQVDNGTETCTAFNTFMNCMTTIFTQGCDKNAGSYVCQEIRAGLMSYDLSCERNGKLNTCPPFVNLNPKMEAIISLNKNRLF